jgi:hypothetical protein
VHALGAAANFLASDEHVVRVAVPAGMGPGRQTTRTQ